MSLQFIWNDSYSVGREDIDTQHKRMFEIANSLPQTSDEVTVGRTVIALYKHTREHFTAEEQMMKDIGYPKLEEHRRLHDDLITKLNNISEGRFNDDESFGAFKLFIYNWVIDHILNHDKDYFIFTQEARGRE